MLINPCVGVGDKGVKDKVEEEYYYETEVKLPSCDRTVGVQQKSLEELSTTHAAAIAASQKNKGGGEVKTAEALTTDTATASALSRKSTTSTDRKNVV